MKKHMVSPKAILVIRNASIGNAILDTPLFPILAQWFPGIPVDLVADTVTADLLSGNPYIRKVWIFKKSEMSNAEQWALAQNWRKEGYSFVVNMVGSVRPALLTLLAGIPIRIGFRLKGSCKFLTHSIVEGSGHVSQNVAKILAPFKREIPLISPQLFTTKESEASANAFLQEQGIQSRFVVMHPAGNTIGLDNWNLPFYREFRKRSGLSDTVPLVVIGSPAEFSRFRTEFSTESNIFYAENLTINAVSALISQASLFVGNDSGPAHIAEAFDIPKIVIYRDNPENFTRWSPIKENKACVLFQNIIDSKQAALLINEFIARKSIVFPIN